MLKKLLKIFGGLVAGIILLIIVASVAVILFVNKGLVEDQMKKALNRHVQIEKISVGIFSIVSGIEVNNVKISNFKSESELKALKGKPVPLNDIFVSMESMRLKLSFLPLLKKQFALKELVMYGPVVNVTKTKDGVFNFDDLTRPKKLTKEEQAELVKKKKQEAKEPKKPLTADDLPVSVTVGEVGMKNGTVNYHDGKHDQKFQAYKITALAHDIQIDPKDLNKKDNVKIKIYMGVKTVGPMKTESVKTFDITIDATGNVKPFDLKTRKLDPEATLHVGSPDGEITGLQIFNVIAGNNVLIKYIGDQLSFLKGKQEWKGSKMAYVDVWYKAGLAKLSNGNINLKEARLLFGGTYNTNTKGVDSDLDLELSEKRHNAIKVGIRKQVESGLKRLGVKKYTNPDKIADAAIKPLVNNKGRIYMKFKVTGTTDKPDAKLVHPQLGSLDDIIKQIAGDVIMESGKEAGKKVIQKEGKKLIKKLPKLF
jgi:hypothetical protein